MRILLTGGAGFIGSHLAERLLRDGHQLAVLDSLDEFYNPSIKRANLAIASGAGPFEFIQCDIRDASSVDTALGRLLPEAVIHLAARAGVRSSIERPLLYESVNVGGTYTLLEAARRHGVRRFVFASSSSVYGEASSVPFCEDDPVRRPISPYAATKLAGEEICYTYSHLHGIEAVCLRFFTVYGPRQRPDLAIRKFMRCIDAGVPIPVFGDGNMGRDYTFIDDIVAGIVSALGYNCRFEVFNLGNSHPVSLHRMVATLEEALGRRAVIDRQALQPGDVHITYADIGKSRRLLGYSPQTPFEEGIRRMVAWFRQASSAPV